MQSPQMHLRRLWTGIGGPRNYGTMQIAKLSGTGSRSWNEVVQFNIYCLSVNKCQKDVESEALAYLVVYLTLPYVITRKYRCRLGPLHRVDPLLFKSENNNANPLEIAT